MRFNEIITETYEFIFEAPADDIIPDMQALGLDDYRKDSGQKLSVYVPRTERKKTIQTLLKRLPNAEYDPNAPGSSLGLIMYKGGKIQIRPAGGAGTQSAGLANEQQLVDTINRFAEEVGPLNVTFVGDNGKSITAKGVTKANSADADTAGRKKSDVNLIAQNKVVPISLKKGNAEYWESADTLWGDKADQIIEKLAAAGKITLTKIGKTRKADGAEFVKVKPEVAVQASPKETLSVVFGSDILGQGGVVKQTFDDEHYKLEGNNLTVTADLVITSPEDIPEENRVYWLIRNDSSRTRPKHKYPGLRVLASYKKRINKNVLLFNRKS